MTRQAADLVFYKGEEYEFLGDSSGQLPMLKQFGLTVGVVSTDCYRGYIAEYAVDDDHFYLTRLSVQDANDNYPEIGGVKPAIKRGELPVYEGLSEPITIDGAIVIGKDFPDDWQGFDIRAPHDYIVVLKLTVKRGIVQSVTDISQQAAAIRSELFKIFAETRDQARFEFENKDRSERIKLLFDRSWALKYSVDDAGIDGD
jgi:hypothetical protein